MNDRMAHRGPDDEGLHADGATGVTLGARRLSIIDVEGGHQPVTNEDGTVVAALNGEIYNHPRLQERLRRSGHVLRSRTDTEVLVHLYEEHGDELVHALEGMYAFALLDVRRRRLLVARDRFGEKPLFYTVEDGELLFASELTSLLHGLARRRRLDLDGVDAFLALGYVPGPGTLADGVSLLPAGHVLTWDVDARELEVRPYWTPPVLRASDGALGHDEMVSETAGLLRGAVRSRLVSDVPTGVLLSGGLDSTLIAALAAEQGPVRTFTVGYEEGGDRDERPVARGVAEHLGTEHHELRLERGDLDGLVAPTIAALDQPIADPALLALHAVCRFARGHVTVALGGEGADELFAGYPRYRWLARAAQVQQVVPRPLAEALAHAADAVTGAGRGRRLRDVLRPEEMAVRHLDWVTDGRWEGRKDLHGPGLADRTGDGLLRYVEAALADESLPLERRLMLLDQRLWLVDDVLAKADRAGMLASLEVRTPYLQHELVEFAASVPVEVHRGEGGKFLLRRVLAEVAPGLPAQPKTAFRVPLADWLRGPLSAAVDGIVASSRLASSRILDMAVVARLVREHASGAADHSATLWPLVVLGLWLEDAPLEV